MAVLHLEFEIDSEVYPELHATLSAIGGEASRGERLRQLAASGLVWEYVRLRMPVAASPRAAADTPGPRAERASPPPARPAGHRAAESPPDRRAPPRGEAGDFVDLAIDATPPAAPARASDARPQEPPLLVDVVDGPAPTVPMPPADGGPPEQPAVVDEGGATRARLLRMRDRGLFRNG